MCRSVCIRDKFQGSMCPVVNLPQSLWLSRNDPVFRNARHPFFLSAPMRFADAPDFLKSPYSH